MPWKPQLSRITFQNIITFFISVKIGFYTIFVVAMVTKFTFVLQNLTFLCFNLHSSMCSYKHKYQVPVLFLSVYGVDNGVKTLTHKVMLSHKT